MYASFLWGEIRTRFTLGESPRGSINRLRRELTAALESLFGTCRTSFSSADRMPSTRPSVTVRASLLVTTSATA